MEKIFEIQQAHINHIGKSNGTSDRILFKLCNNNNNHGSARESQTPLNKCFNVRIEQFSGAYLPGGKPVEKGIVFGSPLYIDLEPNVF